MTNRFMTHFGVIFGAHVLIFFGGWQLSQTQYVQNKISSLKDNALTLQIVSEIVTSSRQKPMETKKDTSTKSANPLAQNVVPEKHTDAIQSTAVLTEKILDTYKAELRARIYENKYYSGISRRMGHQGLVIVTFTLLEDGNIINLRIDTPSAYERLNESALDAVRKVGRFKPIPTDSGQTKMDLRIPIEFKLI